MKDYAYVLHMAPEIRRPDDYSELSDICACGMTLYRLVNGDSLLPAWSPSVAHAQALEGRFSDRKAYREFVPRTLRRVINEALKVDPVKAFSVG
jgi:eukaryotic-like serine/threonine-protein kinase